jgi:uncharacterized protein (DUF2147 family)
MRTIKTLLTLSLITLSTLNAKDLKENDILGYWLSESGRAVIEITKDDGLYNGKLTWLMVEHTKKHLPALDNNNPDEKLKTRKLRGLKMLSGFKYDDGEYEDGKIYDPKSGKTYKSYMELESKDKIKLRGYVGIAMFGRTSYWTRQKTSIPDKFMK